MRDDHSPLRGILIALPLGVALWVVAWLLFDALRGALGAGW